MITEVNVDNIWILMNHGTPESLAKAFADCESGGEQFLLHNLRKVYWIDDIKQQVPVAGYRLDFVTNGVAWELDGKRFHDRERDEIRDKRILRSAVVKAIIRVPAAAVQWFRDACMVGLSLWMNWPLHKSNLLVCDSVDDCIKQADIAMQGSDELDFFLRSLEAVCISDDVLLIGSPYAFIPRDHPVRPLNQRPNLDNTIFTIERRTLANVDSWFQKERR